MAAGKLTIRLRQLDLPLAAHPGWGGIRPGAGRKRRPGARPSVPHLRRAPHRSHAPVLVTLRAVGSLQCLRSERVFPMLRRSVACASKDGFGVIQFSVQRDHIHFIVESDGSHALERGMRGLTTRLAIAANRSLGRSGPVWGDRYHARALLTPKAVRVALAYVLANVRKHLRDASPSDPCSSAEWFDGFDERSRGATGAPPVASSPCPVVPARTWLARYGWRRHGLVALDEAPRRSTFVRSC